MAERYPAQEYSWVTLLGLGAHELFRAPVRVSATLTSRL